MSYGIIKDHAGDITVESEVGKGTTFVVRLPVVDPFATGNGIPTHIGRSAPVAS